MNNLEGSREFLDHVEVQKALELEGINPNRLKHVPEAKVRGTLSPHAMIKREDAEAQARNR